MAHWHTVRQGESVPSIASKYGFNDWTVVYEHGKNEKLRELRSNPYVLAPGDRLFIPDKELRYEKVETEQVHRYQLRRPMEQVRVALEDEDEEPLADLRYKLTVGDHVVEGRTSGEGVVEQMVPAIADEAELLVWRSDDEEPLEWTLEIGRLDPIHSLKGMQARLNNLGFYTGETDGDEGEVTKAAVAAFQRSIGLEPTGEIDETTREQLREVHGS